METIEKAYTLRKLEARDIFAIVRILGKIDFKEIKGIWTARNASIAKLVSLPEEERAEAAQDESFDLGLNLAMVLIKNLPDCEHELYGFIGDMIGKKGNAVAKMDPAEFMDVIIDIISMEQFVDFFKRASALIK